VSQADGLLAAMQAAKDGGAGRARVLAELPAAVLVLPLTSAAQDAAPLVFAAEGGGGGEYVAAFTDIEALARWARPGMPWGSLRGDEVARMVSARAGTSLVLNPAGPAAGELSSEELRWVVDAMARASAKDAGAPGGPTVQAPSGLELRAAGPLPPEHAGAMRASLSDLPGLQAAYLLSLGVPGKAPWPGIGIALDEAQDPQATIDEVGTRLRALFSPGSSFDVLVLDDRQLQALQDGRVEPLLASVR